MQEVLLLEQCGHARYVWNLGLEQRLMWRRWQGPTPGLAEQDRQLTEARAAEPWLADGSVTVQQQALRVRQGNRRWSGAPVPKVGWVKFKRSRDLPDWKSYRRRKVRTAIARLAAREADRRKDWAEKTSTDLARRFDVIRIEDARRQGHDPLGARHLGGAGPPYTSQTCNACGHRAPENRESQAVFRCVACGHQADADVNASCNIADREPAAGRAVAARGDRAKSARSVKREPRRARPPKVA